MDTSRTIVITAGGMKEKIDKVRSIINSSKGTLGVDITKALFAQVDVTIDKVFYLYGPDAVLPRPDERVKLIPVFGALDLQEKLNNILANNKVDYAIHAMAVADYTVDKIMTKEQLGTDDGLIGDKISSNLDEIYIKLKRTPKIIDQIKQCSPHTFLVGFKLLHTSTDDELFAAGFKLLRRSKANLILANDLAQIKTGQPHRGLLIYPEKHLDIIEGGKKAIAKRLVRAMFLRGETRYGKSVEVLKIFPKEYSLELDKLITGSKLLDYKKLPKVDGGTYGNMSVRAKDKFVITGRNVDKLQLDTNTVCLIDNSIASASETLYRTVSYCGQVKPSIDTPIHSMIYEKQPVDAIMHIHSSAIYEDLPWTDNNHPCGSEKEALSICSLLKGEKEFVLQMHKHGVIAGAASLTRCYKLIDSLENKLHILPLDKCDNADEVFDEWLSHRDEVLGNNISRAEILDKRLLRVVIFEGKPIGIIWYLVNYDPDMSLSGEFYLYITKKYEGAGLGFGKRLVSLIEQMAKRDNCSRLRLLTRPGCKVEKYYRDKLDFKLRPTNNELTVLEREITK